MEDKASRSYIQPFCHFYCLPRQLPTRFPSLIALCKIPERHRGESRGEQYTEEQRWQLASNDTHERSKRTWIVSPQVKSGDEQLHHSELTMDGTHKPHDSPQCVHHFPFIRGEREGLGRLIRPRPQSQNWQSQDWNSQN